MLARHGGGQRGLFGIKDMSSMPWTLLERIEEGGKPKAEKKRELLLTLIREKPRRGG